MIAVISVTLAVLTGAMIASDILPRPSMLSAPVIRGIDRKTILLGTTLPLTGAQERLGRGIRAGIQVAIQGANDRGGIHRRQLRLIALDDQSSPHRTLRNMHELVEQRGVFAILGGSGIEAAKAIEPISRDAKLPVFGIMHGSSVLRGNSNPWVINVGADFTTQAKALIAHLQAKENIALGSIAMVAETSEVGDAAVEGWQSAQDQKQNLIMMRVETGKIASPEIMKNIIEKKMAAVVLVANAHDIEEFAHQLAMLAPQTILATLACSDFDLVFEDVKKNNTRRHVTIRNISVSPPPTSSVPLMINYRKDLQQYFPEENPSYPSLYGYITANVTFQMMRHMPRSFDPEQVGAYLQNPSPENIGLIPSMTFDQNSRAMIAKLWLAKIDPSAVGIEYEALP
jgi:ABC-type branched-subunit amino acid transport system substrate-binding protein